MELNFDLGARSDESKELYALATMVSVACGAHVGDLASMARAVSFALARGVRVAAHVSYPNREAERAPIEAKELAAAVEAQCAALRDVATKIGASVAGLKLADSLYADAAKSSSIARASIEGAIRALGQEFVVVGAPEGELRYATNICGLRYLREGFADRAYGRAGAPLPSSDPAASIDEPHRAAHQALALAGSGNVDVISARSTGRNAVAVASAVRAALLDAQLLASSR